MINGIGDPPPPTPPRDGGTLRIAPADPDARNDRGDRRRAKWLGEVRGALREVAPLVSALEADAADPIAAAEARARIAALIGELEAIRGDDGAPGPEVIERIEALIRRHGEPIAIGDGPDADAVHAIAQGIVSDALGALAAQGGIDPSTVRTAVR